MVPTFSASNGIHINRISLLLFGALLCQFLAYRRVSLYNQFAIKLSWPRANSTMYLPDTLSGTVLWWKRNSAATPIAKQPMFDIYNV